MPSVKVSIIIVKYQSEKYLSNCLASIGKNPGEEIIIVDNDRKNLGFGTACNQGAKKALGQYLLFLNPDTYLMPGMVKTLRDFMELRKDAGIVGSLLLDEKEKPYPLQGADQLTPLAALATFSFLHKYFPNNSISFKYWLKDWDKKSPKEVVVGPGAAFMIRKEVFEKVGGFDENFFLYFEETDLCQRVREAGWKIYINPEAKVIHYSKKSTPDDPKIKKIFKKSRFYYFKKHWGIIPAVLVESFLRGSEWLAEKI